MTSGWLLIAVAFLSQVLVAGALQPQFVRLFMRATSPAPVAIPTPKVAAGALQPQFVRVFMRATVAIPTPKANNRSNKLGSLPISPMGIGTWAWGNKAVWGYDEGMDGELQEAYNLCVKAGLNWFDTADSYGTGKITGQAERLLGEFSKALPSSKVIIATKFAPYPSRIGVGSIKQACKETLERLGRDSLEVGQLHWRPPLGWQEREYWQGLAELKFEGKIKEIGLSNYGPKKLQLAHGFLKDRDIQLASNQVQFSLLSRYPLQNGLFEMSRELGVTNIAYSPLCLGLLTGKYNLSNMPNSGPRRLIFSQLLPTMGPLLGTLSEVAKSRNKSMSQVALNWTICKGGVPIVGVKNVEQAKQNLGALGWKLSAAEVDELDVAAKKVGKQSLQNIFSSD